MSLDSHVAILTHHALAAAVQNQKKASKPMEFYGLFAFPPAAANDLAAIAATVANGAPLGNFEIGITTNAQTKNPIAGVPGDWFIVRAATQFAPYVADATGAQLEQGNPAHAALIRSTFYAGKRVRVMLSAFSWVYDKRPGISFNLSGVMDAGEQGERLAIGNGAVVNAFQKHANPNATSALVPGATATEQPANNGNPFGGASAQGSAGGASQSANPFAQSVATTGNPFATA
jgi:hypothetical protein